MAFIKPFKAIRPNKKVVQDVVTRSFESYSSQEIESILKNNKDSFLQIILPDSGVKKKKNPKKKHKEIRTKYLEFISRGILIEDNKDHFYLYKLEAEGYSSCGILCATKIEEYRNASIKIHENTISKREKLFADYLDVVGFKAEPVLMIYEDQKAITQLIDNETKKEPEYYFKTSEGYVHSLWKISHPKTIDSLVHEFSNVDSLYIGDGHHRCASTSRYAQRRQNRNPNHNGKEAYNYIMSFLVAQTQVKIYEFNRMVKDLNGHSKESFFNRLSHFFTIHPKGTEIYKPKTKDHISMYFDGMFYSLHLKADSYTFTNTLSKLDTQILYKTVLEPILGIRDLRNDKRMAYGFGKNNVEEMKKKIDAGKFKVGFSLLPLTVEEIKNISDEGLVMPPKSSYIEPKLRSGLTIYKLF